MNVALQGPSGDCFYVPGREDQPLLLAGTGTGLAPLYGILRDALARGHRGPIHLFHGALNPAGLYLREELTAIAGAHGNVRYTPAVLDAAGERGVETGPIDKVIAQWYPDLDGWRAFVCGDPALVQSLRKKLFLSGVASGDIYADAFVPNAA
jgi:NAD(P)H-flavin reductase